MSANKYLTPIEYKTYWEKGIDYATYLQNFEEDIKSGINPYNRDKLPINWQRSSRINKTFHLNDEDLEILEKIPTLQKWIVITEHWCGDSAQIIPVISKIADASQGKIELRLVYRDTNLTLMNAHLTNGSKSVPRLIQLNEKFEVISEYGPRPAIAQKMVMEMKSNPTTASKYSEELHKWYAKDQQVQISRELLKMIGETL